MKRYKNVSGEIYAYEDDVSQELLNQKMQELKIDEKAKQLAEIEAEIAECENHIKHALIIGNNNVLENLRAEYKELIIQREGLK